jgi:CBS domain-containing protein
LFQPTNKKSLSVFSLCNACVTLLCTDRKLEAVLYIDLDESARKAMAIMSQYNVLSLPVWDKQQKQYTCFISVVDVLRFCMTEAATMNTSSEGSTQREVLVRDVVKEIEVDEETQVEIWNPSVPASQV